MSLPLLRKEAREHGPVLAATAVIGLVALFTILGVAAGSSVLRGSC